VYAKLVAAGARSCATIVTSSCAGVFAKGALIVEKAKWMQKTLPSFGVGPTLGVGLTCRAGLISRVNVADGFCRLFGFALAGAAPTHALLVL
jgi:hypothetical protein